MRGKKISFFVFGFLFFVTNFSYSQSANRNYIKDAIKDWGSCRNVAITKRNGDVAINFKNACAWQNVPQTLANALQELSDNGEFIDDVQLTDNGEWLVLYGNNGIHWSNIPKGLENVLRKANSDGEVITSITFNDTGAWIVISEEHFWTSSDWWTNWLNDGLKKFGQIWAVCITDDAAVAVFEKGYKYDGNVPNSLKNALADTDLNVYRLKIAGTSWFFADVDGNYEYNM